VPPKSSVHHSRPSNRVSDTGRVRRGASYEMEPVRGALQKVLAGILNRFPPEQVPLEAWPFVCGKQVSRRTQPISFAGGILRVKVPDAAWRAQLQELRGRYLAGLNQYSAKPVENIEFVLAAVAGSSTPANANAFAGGPGSSTPANANAFAGGPGSQQQKQSGPRTPKTERAVKQRQARASSNSSGDRKKNGGNKSKRK